MKVAQEFSIAWKACPCFESQKGLMTDDDIPIA